MTPTSSAAAYFLARIDGAAMRVVPYDPGAHRAVARQHARLVGDAALSLLPAFVLEGSDPPAYCILQGNKIDWLYAPGNGARMLRFIRRHMRRAGAARVLANVSVDRRELPATVARRLNFWLGRARFRVAAVDYHPWGVVLRLGHPL